MSNPNLSLLLMDDEIASADVVEMTVKALQQTGFDVDTTARMSEAMEAFYQRYYRVFVLDIDMSFVADVQEGDGSLVARFLRTLDSDTKVIFFSARGQIQHWFAAANYHVFGYIHKNASRAIERLVEMSLEAAQSSEEPPLLSSPPQAPPQALLLGLEPCTTLPIEVLEDTARQTLPQWDIETATSLDAALSALDAAPDSWGLVLAATDTFSTRPSVQEKLSALCQRQARPQTVVACQGKESAMASILSLVNHHPFRLIDSLASQSRETLARAIHDAALHYGRREHLEASPEALRRLHLAFSEETYEQLSAQPDPEEFLDDEEFIEDEDLLENKGDDGEAPHKTSLREASAKEEDAS